MNEELNPQEMTNSSKAYALFYSFFLIPLMMTIFAVLFFFLFKMLTYESQNPYDLLNNIKSGSLTKRWQSAFELSNMMSDIEKVPNDDLFINQLSEMYRKSKRDDESKVRTYLALAMGQTTNSIFCIDLKDGLNDANLTNKIAAIKSIGMIGCSESVDVLNNMINSKYEDELRLYTIISLGQILDHSSVPYLKDALEDEEPNIRWDAALALAKLNDKSGYDILRNLLKRAYYENFTLVNISEIDNTILTVLRILNDVGSSHEFKQEIILLSKLEKNIKIRDFAMQIVADY